MIRVVIEEIFVDGVALASTYRTDEYSLVISHGIHREIYKDGIINMPEGVIKYSITGHIIYKDDDDNN